MTKSRTPETVMQEMKDKKFTGNVTFHFTGGVPRKVKIEEVADLAGERRRVVG